MAKIRHVQNQDEMNDILQSCGDSLAVVDFWAIRCKQCLTIAPVFDKMSEEKLYQTTTFLKVNVEEAEDVAMEWQIQYMPTVIVIRNNEQIDSLIGGDEDKLRDMLMKHMT